MKLTELSAKEKTFLLLFFASFATLYLLVQALPIEFLLEKLTELEVLLMQQLGASASHYQTTVFTPQIEFEIVKDCSGLLMVSLLASLLFAYSYSENKFSAKKLLRTLLLYAPLLLAFNALRLLVTLLVGARYGQGVLEAVHFTLWLVDSGVVLLVWMKTEKISLK